MNQPLQDLIPLNTFAHHYFAGYNLSDWTILGLILGLILGSFLNVLTVRLPIILKWREKPDYLCTPFNLFLPRSSCMHCGKTIAWWQNIPILSYMLLKGKANCCHAPIAKRYLLIELSMALLTAGLFNLAQNPFVSFFWLIFITLAVAIIVIDFEYLLIPDSLNYSLLWSGLIYQTLLGNADIAIYSAVIAYSSFWLINGLYKLIRKADGLGHGDFKLFTGIAAWFGWYELAPILFIASVLGIGFALLNALKNRQWRLNTQIAFAPWLLSASFIIGLVRLLNYSS